MSKAMKGDQANQAYKEKEALREKLAEIRQTMKGLRSYVKEVYSGKVS